MPSAVRFKSARSAFNLKRWFASGQVRQLGIIAAMMFAAAMLLPDPGPIPGLRNASFDTYQSLLPRERRSAPATIVAIDDASLASIGQWPWPRDKVAELINRIAARQPAAIGLEIVFPEADRMSPDRLAETFRARDSEVADRLAKLPSNDSILAQAIRAAPVALGIVGTDYVTPFRTTLTPVRTIGQPAHLRRFPGSLASLPEIDDAATGHGLLNAQTEHGVVRRMPLAASIAGLPVLGLSLESVRIAARQPAYTLRFDDQGLASVDIAELRVPTQKDGSFFVHFGRHDPARYVSAADVLEGRETPAMFENKVVLVGVTAIGLLDHQTTSGGERMPGIEFHAQVVENIFDGSILRRPGWARWVEALAFALTALVVIVATPRIPPRRSLFLPLGCWAVLATVGFAAYHWGLLLFDPGTPIMGISVLYGVVLSATLVASDLKSSDLSHQLEAQREAAARAAGELEAARRIQTAMLPMPADVLRADGPVEMFAYMRPAREVGGDLYDFFHLPNDRLFVAVGDVAGKGLAAAMFMAVSKALAKSATLRGELPSMADMVTTLNAEVSRENPDQLFVTLVALVIDLRSGVVEYCNAGHELPVLLRTAEPPSSQRDGGGPPLCAIDDFTYSHAGFTLQSGDLLALVSDGLTEAMNPARQLYGRERLVTVLAELQKRDDDIDVIGREVLAHIHAFEAGSEPADDQTLVLLRWR